MTQSTASQRSKEHADASFTPRLLSTIKERNSDEGIEAGAPTNIQFMVKDSKKYAATRGWGFGHFSPDGKPADAAFMKPCYPCHAQNKAHDLVFTLYAP